MPKQEFVFSELFWGLLLMALTIFLQTNFPESPWVHVITVAIAGVLRAWKLPDIAGLQGSNLESTNNRGYLWTGRSLWNRMWGEM